MIHWQIDHDLKSAILVGGLVFMHEINKFRWAYVKWGNLNALNFQSLEKMPSPIYAAPTCGYAIYDNKKLRRNAIVAEM